MSVWMHIQHALKRSVLRIGERVRIVGPVDVVGDNSHIRPGRVIEISAKQAEGDYKVRSWATIELEKGTSTEYRAEYCAEAEYWTTADDGIKEYHE